MKRRLLLFLLVGLVSTSYAQLLETFNGTTTPSGWSTSGISGWRYGGTMGYAMSNTTDHTGNNGNWAWCDGSSPYPGVAVLQSRTFNASSLTNPHLIFWWRSNITGYNTTYNATYIDFYTGSTWVALDTLSRSSANNAWEQISINLSGITLSGTSQRMRFRVDKKGSIPYYNDVAFDDVEVKSVVNDNANLASLQTNILCGGTDSLRIELKNSGANNITSVKINYSVRGVARTPYRYSGTLAPNASVTLAIDTINSTLGQSYPLRFEVDSVNNKIDPDTTNDVLIDTLGTGMSGSYTVAGASPDYATLALALQDLRSKGACGNVNLRIRPGTYTAQMGFAGGIVGLGSNAWVTVMPDSGVGTVKFQFGSDALVFNNAEYIRVKGIEVSTTSNSASAVYIYGNNNNIHIDSCTLNGATSPLSATSSAYATVYEASGSNPCPNLSITNCEINDGSMGVFVYGAGTTSLQDSLLLANCNIKGWTYAGFYSWYLSNTVIANNTMTARQNGTSTQYGMYCYYNDFSKIYGNNVLCQPTSNGQGSALYMVLCDGSTSNKIQVYNNMFTSNVQYNSTSGYVAYASSCTQMDFVNNSVYGNNASSSTAGEVVYWASTTGCTFRNNAVQNAGNSPCAYFSSSITTRSNNVWDCTNTTKLNYTLGTNSAAGSCNFTAPSTGDLHANAPDLDSAGMAMAWITTDIDGQARNSTHPDVGADEFDVAYHDASPTFVSNTNLCVGNNNVTATIKNIGLSPLTSATINWAVATNGGSWVTRPAISLTGMNLSTGGDTTLSLGSFLVTAGNNYEIRVITSSPNGQTDQNMGNDTIKSGSLGQSLAAGIYTVGGTSPDYANLAAAVAALSDGICGNVTFRLRAGTHSQNLTIGAVDGTGPNAWVTFTADTGLSTMPTITQSSDVVNFNGASYIRIDGLNLRSSFGNCVQFLGANSHIVLSNNKMEGYKSTSAQTSTSYALIYDYSGTANQTNNLTIENNEMLDGSFGMYIYGGGTGANAQDSIKIRNNTIKGHGYHGIYSYYNYNSEIHGNELESHPTAYSFGSVSIFSYYNYSTRITENKALMTVGSGYASNLYVFASTGTTTHRSLIANNMLSCFGSSTTNTTTAVSYFSSISNTDVYYNSWYGTFQGTSSSYGLIRLLGTSTANFKNNCVYNNGSGRAAYFSGMSGTNNDYNNIKSTGSANHTGTVGSNTKFVVPGYADPSKNDLHVNNRDLDENATPIAGITTDIDGDTRSTTAPDIGADEFVPILRDASPTAVNEQFCPGSNNINVTVRNVGIDSLASVTVNWAVSTNGGAFVAQTPFSFTGGNIRNGNDTTVTVGTLTTSSTSTYRIMAYTTNPNGGSDQKVDNDTIMGDSAGVSIGAGTYTIGGTNPDYATFTAAVNDMMNKGICGPVNFMVRQGTYNERVDYGAVEGAGMNSWVTFMPDTNNNSPATLQFNSAYTLRFTNAGYVTFKGLNIKTTGFSNVIEFNGGAHHITFDDNVIEGTASNSTTTSYAVFYETGQPAVGNLKILNNEIKEGSQVFYSTWGSTSAPRDSIWINNNTITEFYDDAFFIYYGSYIQIHNNHIESQNSPYSSGPVAMYLYFMDHPVITKNTVLMKSTSYCSPLYLYFCEGTPGNRGLIANNMFSTPNATASTTTTSAYSYLYYPYYVDIVNNSWYGRYAYSSSTIYGLIRLYGNGNVTFSNNSIHNQGNGYAAYINSTSINERNNNYYGSTTRDRSPASGGTGNVSLIPGYANPAAGDLHCTNANNDGRGFSLAYVTDDIDGDMRNASTPDIGADEYLAIKDLRITSLTKPMGPCYNEMDTIWVDYRNSGVFNLNMASADSFKINWEITGASTQSGMINYNTGTLNAGATGTAWFIADLSSIGTHNISTYLTSGFDTVRTNDSAMTSIVVNKPVTPGVASPARICNGDSILMSSTGSGGVINWFTDSNLTALAGTGSPGYLGMMNGDVTYWFAEAGTNGCLSTPRRHTVSADTVPVISFGPIGDVCENQTSIDLTSYASRNGGVYTGSGVSGTTFDAGSVSASSHVITWTFTDLNNCTAVDTATATVNVAPTVSSTFSNITNCTSDDGKIVISASGGTGSFRYSINGGVSSRASSTFDTLGTGSYTVQVNDGICTVTDTTYTAAVPSAPPKPTAGTGATYCKEDTYSNLTASFGTGGGSGQMIWFLDGGLTTPHDTGTSVPVVDTATTIVYYVIEEDAGCRSSADTMAITINPLPVVNQSTINSMCDNASSIILGGGTPTGGVYTGTGVSSGSFNPGTATAGNHLITYTYTDNNNCFSTDTTSITVYATTITSITALSDVCANNSSFTLTNGSPSGGVYKGTGVNSGVFNPGSAMPGTHPITYVLTNSDGCMDSSTTNQVVDTVPIVSMTSISDRCIDAGTLTLNQAMPAGGTYSGPGVSGTAFNPVTAGPGTHTIKYVFTDGNSCTDSTSRTAHVDSLPVATMTSLANVCENTPAFNLTNASASPTGGTGMYYGNGVMGGMFNPDSANPGTHMISYAYVDNNGCRDTAMTNITVDTVPVVTTTGFGSWCAYDTNITLMGGMPMGGKFTGNGVDTNGVFNPSKVAAGPYVFTYTYTDGNNCTDTSMKTAIVNALPNVTMQLQRKICLNSTAITLSGGRPVATSGISGVYSGNNVSSGQYQPSALTVDTITYTFTDNNTCVNSASKVIRVDSVPTVSMATLPHFCEGAPSMMLTQGMPMGGTYSGGLTVGGTSFDPTTAGSYTVTYTYADANSCMDSVSGSVTVDTVPVVSLAPMSNVCSNTPSMNLMGGMPMGGTYSGAGVSGMSFDPNAAGAGTHTIQYAFIDANNCGDSVTTPVTVRQAPSVSLADLGYICQLDNPKLLSGGMPVGGMYSGPGVSGGSFDPNDTSRLGGNTITYVFVAANSCEDSASKTITVEANPEYNLGSDITSCGADIRTLTVNLTGVTYLWSNGATTQSVQANASANWSCYVVDTATNAGCTYRDTVVVNYEAVCVGIAEDLKDRVNVKYYPNPTSGAFMAEIEGLEGETVEMKIVNMQGQVVYETNWEEMPEMFKGQIDLSSESSGMYFINLSTENGSVMHRISLNR